MTWQITACDAASSYGAAAILPVLKPTAAATFLRDTLAPLFAPAGWPLRHVLADGGNEFKRVFDQVCAARASGIRAPSRAPPGPTGSANGSSKRS